MSCLQESSLEEEMFTQFLAVRESLIDTHTHTHHDGETVRVKISGAWGVEPSDRLTGRSTSVTAFQPHNNSIGQIPSVSREETKVQRS